MLRLAALVSILVMASTGCVEWTGNEPPHFLIEGTPSQVLTLLTVNVTLVVEDPYTFTHQGGAPDYDVQVWKEGIPVTSLYEYGSWPQYGVEAVRDVTLTEDSTQVFNWNGHVDPQGGGPRPPHGGERAPTGTYTIVVQHRHIDFLRAEETIQLLEELPQPM